MKVKDLIELLIEIDPIGEKEILIRTTQEAWKVDTNLCFEIDKIVSRHSGRFIEIVAKEDS